METTGLLRRVLVQAADVREADMAPWWFAAAYAVVERLPHIWADMASRGQRLRTWVAEACRARSAKASEGSHGLSKQPLNQLDHDRQKFAGPFALLSYCGMHPLAGSGASIMKRLFFDLHFIL